MDRIKVEKFLLGEVPLASVDAARPPMVHDFEKLLLRIDDGGVRPDGLPYSAWGADISAGATTLSEVDVWIRRGPAFPLLSINSFFAWIPKGKEKQDIVKCTRSAGKVRPIGLKNTSSKTIAAVTARRAESAFELHSSQRGFRRGHNIGNNIIDLDAAARIGYMRNLLGAVILCDVATAFLRCFTNS